MVASTGPDEYRQTIEIALADEETDVLLVIYAPVRLEFQIFSLNPA